MLQGIERFWFFYAEHFMLPTLWEHSLVTKNRISRNLGITLLLCTQLKVPSNFPLSQDHNMFDLAHALFDAPPKELAAICLLSEFINHCSDSSRDH